MDIAIAIGVSLFLAFITESSVEYLFGIPMDKIPVVKPYKWLLQYIAVGVGIFSCFHYGLDLVTLITKAEPTWLGIGFSGVLVSRGADWLHTNVFSKYIPWKG